MPLLRRSSTTSQCQSKKGLPQVPQFGFTQEAHHLHSKISPVSNPRIKQKPSVFRKIASALGWTRSSYTLMSMFVLTLFVLGYVWWPLAEEYLELIPWEGEWWRYMDWLLINIFLFMSLMIMAGADLKVDAKIIFVGMIGGLVIESWGTQTEIWTYYTDERPPLWIIPAWPIASLTIDRMVRFARRVTTGIHQRSKFEKQELSDNGRMENGGASQSVPRLYIFAYWVIFPFFYALMLWFVAPTFDKSFTLIALLLCALFIATPTDYRIAVLTFLAGTGLGYYLELWGTTRLAWTYYTLEQPPVFAVFAHGMAAVAFWRAVLLLEFVGGKLRSRLFLRARPARSAGQSEATSRLEGN